ncbi:MAG: GtrA family protein [Candidatus ainarchaeum sp.]|nr:GtrA family protein [Candidatus ainarchaeum sp.]MDD3975811.1 GtrA family protein [Candidatus ainarchaeum sp.]
MTQKKITDFKYISNKKYSFSKSLLSIKKNSFLHNVYYRLIEISILYKYKNRIKYGFISLIGEFTDIFILFILTHFFNFYYLFSALISYFCAIFINFNLNKKFTFKYNEKNLKEYFLCFLKYFLISIGGMIINLSLLAFLVEFFSINYLISKLIVNIIVFIFIYKGHSFVLKLN